MSHETNVWGGKLANVVAVGDLNSDAKGSGARKNANKPQLDLIPVRIWADLWDKRLLNNTDLDVLMGCLIDWQEGKTGQLEYWLKEHGSQYPIDETVKVLEFGAQKYKSWNWAKGMPWSVCVGCILRHIQKMLDGEPVDSDSGQSHWAHVMCNVIFLVHYARHYPEGDDRPPQYT
jgi:hypothetical protein